MGKRHTKEKRDEVLNHRFQNSLMYQVENDFGDSKKSCVFIRALILLTPSSPRPNGKLKESNSHSKPRQTRTSLPRIPLTTQSNSRRIPNPPHDPHRSLEKSHQPNGATARLVTSSPCYICHICKYIDRLDRAPRIPQIQSKVGSLAASPRDEEKSNRRRIRRLETVRIRAP